MSRFKIGQLMSYIIKFITRESQFSRIAQLTNTTQQDDLRDIAGRIY
jgi:hypothetical protein